MVAEFLNACCEHILLTSYECEILTCLQLKPWAFNANQEWMIAGFWIPGHSLLCQVFSQHIPRSLLVTLLIRKFLKLLIYYFCCSIFPFCFFVTIFLSKFIPSPFGFFSPLFIFLSISLPFGQYLWIYLYFLRFIFSEKIQYRMNINSDIFNSRQNLPVREKVYWPFTAWWACAMIWKQVQPYNKYIN